MIEYFKTEIMNERADLNIDVRFSNMIYMESVSLGQYFRSLHKILTGYINQKKEIRHYYNERKNLISNLDILQKVCEHDKKIANTKILIRGYNDKLMKTKDVDEMILFAKNMFAITDIKIGDPEIYKYFKDYTMRRSGWDKLYEIKIKDIPSLYVSAIKNIDKTIENLELTLHDIQHYIDAEEMTVQKKKNIGMMFEAIKEAISKHFNILTMNIEVIQYEVNIALHKKTEEMSSKFVKEPSDKLAMKNSTKVKEITYGDDVYNIYETEYPNISCFNYGGNDIYVDKGFFDLPKGYQLAILYHEIGHHQCKHFRPKSKKELNNLKVEDDTEIIKRIIRDSMRFYADAHTYSRYPGAYDDGSELMYLLLEWDADRFASKMVGKFNMKSALSNRFRRGLNAKYKNPTPNQKDIIDFNNDRMMLRTFNI